MKKFFLFIGLGLSIATYATTLSGTVLTDASAPVANAVVSDGYSVVTTDMTGNYTMPYNPSAKFVFVSVPSGYDFPVDDTGTPIIWQAIDTNAQTHVHSFTIHPQADGGKADSAHVLLVLGDPQVYDTYCLWRFRNETVEDMIQLKEAYPKGTSFVTLIVGDLVWDKYKYFPNQKANLEATGIPYFIAIGNHDHNRSAAQQPTQAIQDSVASILFENAFGPTYYSFNKGNVHYVILDNVYYKGYDGGDKKYDCALTPKQEEWVKKDIAQLAVGTQVVFAMHINVSNMYQTRVMLQNLVKPLGTTCYIMSGHVHTNTVNVMAADFIEHNIGGCQGSYWSCNWCGDGSPNGYKVFELSAQGMTNCYWKPTGGSKDWRIRTYPTNSINAGNSKFTSVLANVWDWDKNCTVKILENGTEYKMKQFEGTDPDTYDLMLDEGDTRPNYPGIEGGTDADRNPGSKKTGHIFSYIPKDTTATLEVVFTDRYGNVSKAPILRHMMVASFTNLEGEWLYEQDFNSLPRYPNYFTSAKISRGTWVAGHTPMGWYCSTSNRVLPGEGTVTWGGYEYLYINNGSLANSWLYSYGAGDPSKEGEHDKDRALGSLNSVKDKLISQGLLLENNTGSTITSLDITYTGEVWRVGADASTQDRLDFRYAVLTDAECKNIRDRVQWIGAIEGTSVEALSFVTPSTFTAKQSSTTNAATDGNNANNRAELHATIDLTLLPGEVIMLRWDDTLIGNDKDQGLAIDDVSIVATCQTDVKVPSLLDTKEVQVTLRNGQIQITTQQSTYSIVGQTLSVH